MQDDASVQLALMAELLAGRTPPSLELIDKNSVREYKFTREDASHAQTPRGCQCHRSSIGAPGRPTAPAAVTPLLGARLRAGYIPMKVEQTKGSEVQWTLTIQSLKRD